MFRVDAHNIGAVSAPHRMLYKWKNFFHEMKGVSSHEKQREQEDAYTKTESHSYIFVMLKTVALL